MTRCSTTPTVDCWRDKPGAPPRTQAARVLQRLDEVLDDLELALGQLRAAQARLQP
jgi:hypothetical protein